MKTIHEDYPCGPCELPLKCTCGTVITEENEVKADCKDDCEICECYIAWGSSIDDSGNGKCPNCGEHWHCGGCV